MSKKIHSPEPIRIANSLKSFIFVRFLDMKLSVVIVNYNVEYFLEQCLYSVRRALEGIEGEVFVVDNNSVDRSLKMLEQKFPEVKVIANRENVGFSRANNQAIRVSTGEYVLLLNPDTVVEDDTFRKTLAFMDAHPDAEGLGVKMLDGKGRYLPESKRGLPTPATAFFKMFGLTKMFPQSLLLAALATLGAAELKIGTAANYPPFEYVDEQNKITGFDMDLVAELAKRAGFEYKIVNMSFDGLIPALKTGKIDAVASAMSATDDRRKSIDFTQAYYATENIYLRAKGNDAIASKESLYVISV